MEAPSPLGCNALPVVAFVNKLSAALAKEGIQTSYCIGSMRGDTALAQALNKTAMRTVPMGLCAHTAFHSALPSRAAVVYRPRPHHTLLGSESAGWKGQRWISGEIHRRGGGCRWVEVISDIAAYMHMDAQADTAVSTPTGRPRWRIGRPKA
jgi:hypothetical protein